jgi:hypothetical protein
MPPIAPTSEPIARLERRWERSHPAGGVTWADRTHLTLWNFAVGEATLKTEHRKALRKIHVDNELSIRGGASVHIEAHASQSGDEAGNLELSRQRAMAVALALGTLLVPASQLSLTAVGERGKDRTAPTGEQLARDRRVEIHLEPPAARQQPPSSVTEPVGQSSATAPSAAPPTTPAAGPLTMRLKGPIRFGPVDILAPPYGWFVVGGTINVLQIDPDPAPARVSIGVDPQSVKVAVEGFIGSLPVVLSHDSFRVGLRVSDDLEIQPVINLGDPRWPLFTAEVTAPAIPRGSEPPFDIAGVRFRIASVTMRVGFRPNPELLRKGVEAATRLAPWLRTAPLHAARLTGAAAAVAVPVAAGLAYLGFVAYGMKQLAREPERGRTIAWAANIRRGYARLLVHLAQDLPATPYNIGVSGWPAQDDALLLGAALAWQGWQDLGPNDREALHQWARRRPSPLLNANTIVDWLGNAGMSDGSFPHPQDFARTIARPSPTDSKPLPWR